MLNLPRVLKGFIGAGLWLEEGEGGTEALSLHLVENALEFCEKAIVKTNEDDQIEYCATSNSEQFGHDLFLTCNGHGVGFWDRDLGALGERLTNISEGLGVFELYVGDDGLMYSN